MPKTKSRAEKKNDAENKKSCRKKKVLPKKKSRAEKNSGAAKKQSCQRKLTS